VNFFQQLYHLIRKEMTIEWRQKYALGGILLYVVATVVIIYVSFQSLPPVLWVSLFWIIILFASVNAVAKSFIQEDSSRKLYYYSLTSPRAVIFSKMIYNIGLLSILGILGFVVYTLIMGNPIIHKALFFSVLALGILSFSAIFTMLSAIAAQAGGNAALMPILSLPLIIPVIYLVLGLSRFAVTGFGEVNIQKDILTIVAINAIIIALSSLLFPYLWRE